MGRNRPDSQEGKLGEEADSSPRLRDDEFYRALASAQRRRLLSILLDGEERTVEELATLLAGWRATDDGRLVTPADRTRISGELIHIHLPQLSEARLIDYDREAGTVCSTDLDDAIADLIRRSVEAEQQSS